nr:MAG TPA: hypothetical protein [Caudoviricetes sp.]
MVRFPRKSVKTPQIPTKFFAGFWCRKSSNYRFFDLKRAYMGQKQEKL